MIALIENALTDGLSVLAGCAVVALLALRLLGRSPRTARLMLVLLAISAVRIALVSAEWVDLSGDEAYYWDWSRRLDWCYFSKGPVVALLIRGGTELLGHTPLGVRAPSIVLFLATSILLYAYTRRALNERAAIRATLLLQIVPLFAFYSMAMTIDAPLIFFWMLSLALLQRALDRGRWYVWLAVGLSAGLGLLSKYSMALFAPCALLAMLATRERRRQLASPWPWLAAAIALACLTPVLLWDAHHGWVNFGHNLGHTEVEQGLRIDFEALGTYVGSQLGVITPVLAILAVAAAIRNRKADDLSFWFCVPILAVLLLKSVQGKVQPNWPMPAWLTGLAAFAGFYLDRFKQRNVHDRRFTIAAVAVAALGSAGVLAIPLASMLPLPDRLDPTPRIRGWRELGRDVGAIYQGLDNTANTFVWSERYQTAALLAFYMPGHPRTQCLDPLGRMSQYDLWRDYADLQGKDGLYVSYGPRAFNPVIAEPWSNPQRRELTVTDPAGNAIRTFVIVIAQDYAGYDNLPGSDKWREHVRTRE